MSYPIETKLVIAVSSSALFDLSASDGIYRDHGVDVYRAYQREREQEILDPGIAFPLVKRLLGFNEGSADPAPIEVVLLSRNDPDTGLRVMNSISFHELPITRAAFVSGQNPFEYAEAFNASLCLSANPDDVKRATDSGIPAAHVLPNGGPSGPVDPDDGELRIAFDFDGVIVDDSAEATYQRYGLAGFMESEQRNADIPMAVGPLHRFFTELSRLQTNDRELKKSRPEHKTRIKLAIVTARNAPAHERLVKTLRSFGVNVDQTFFLGGIDKGRVLKVFRPHIFFDDQMSHVLSAATCAPSAHVPFGVSNPRLEASKAGATPERQ